MKKSIALFIAASSMIVSTGAMAFGNMGHGDEKNQCKMGGDRALLKQLELTDEQQKQLADVQDKNNAAKRASIKNNMQAYKDAMEAMNSIIYADKFDEAQAKEVATKAADYQIKNQVEIAKGRYDMLQVLTAEQREQFKTLEAENMQNCVKAFKDTKAMWEKRHSDQ